MITEATIAALSTPLGEGAVAVVRISGADAATVLGRIFVGRDPAATPRQMVYGRVVVGEETLDRVLAVVFPAPSSYTGETMAEVHCHGGILVSSRVLQAVLSAGARAAEPGEFTRRAFLNGKLDLTQAEAVMDIIRAKTPAALRAAEAQLEGALGRRIGDWGDALLELVANVEAWIDFPEEDIDPATGAALEEAIRAASAEAEALLATAEAGRILREGVSLVLCGAPNAGKSSLLNRLLGCERAIVNETPGTTRDTIEEMANFGGIPFRITDTAGLRPSGDPVEREGILRATKAMQAADLVLRVVDVTQEPNPAPSEDPREIVVLNKIDLLPDPPQGLAGEGAVRVSCATGEGIDGLVALLAQRVCGSPAPPSAAAINARHKACLARAQAGLQDALHELRAGQPPEFAALGLRTALDAAGEILGATDTEDILGAIFSRFCIGK